MVDHPVVTGPVLVIGAGLVGSSLGMALGRAGVDVILEDLRTSHALVAASLGAGRVSDPDPTDVAMVVVATPPATIASAVSRWRRSPPWITRPGRTPRAAMSRPASRPWRWPSAESRS